FISLLPESPEFGGELKPSSVAVFIKQRHGVDLDFFTPRIRRLVSTAVEGVDYEHVTVVLVEGEATQGNVDPRNRSFTEILPGLGIRTTDASYFWEIATICGIILALLVLTNIVTLFSFAKARNNSRRYGNGFQPDSSSE
ncbi:secretory protein YscJ/FliF family protein, partial [Rhizobium sp. PDO1-076]